MCNAEHGTICQITISQLVQRYEQDDNDGSVTTTHKKVLTKKDRDLIDISGVDISSSLRGFKCRLKTPLFRQTFSSTT